MTLNDVEKEFKKVIGIIFYDNAVILLCFDGKKTSFEVYSEIGEYFYGQEIILLFKESKDYIVISITSTKTGDTITSNRIEYDKGNYDKFLEKVESDSIIELYSGYKFPGTEICKPNIVDQYRYKLLVYGYQIV